MSRGVLMTYSEQYCSHRSSTERGYSELSCYWTTDKSGRPTDEVGVNELRDVVGLEICTRTVS